ncbi:hypothetical protein [Thiolapillus sp.]|uniref:hypothetical protein n=1 Tax=Thiolapillus sp. TaxID=2017437 RepID=UPI003AF88A58
MKSELLDMDDEALSMYLMNQQIVTEDMTMLELSDLTHEELVLQSKEEAQALAERGFAVDTTRIYCILELLRDEAIRTREYLGD